MGKRNVSRRCFFYAPKTYVIIDHHHHHHWVLIKVQVLEHCVHRPYHNQWARPGNWLAAHRADLTLGKTAICIDKIAIIIVHE